MVDCKLCKERKYRESLDRYNELARRETQEKREAAGFLPFRGYIAWRCSKCGLYKLHAAFPERYHKDTYYRICTICEGLSKEYRAIGQANRGIPKDWRKETARESEPIDELYYNPCMACKYEDDCRENVKVDSASSDEERIRKAQWEPPCFIAGRERLAELEERANRLHHEERMLCASATEQYKESYYDNEN